MRIVCKKLSFAALSAVLILSALLLTTLITVNSFAEDGAEQKKKALFPAVALSMGQDDADYHISDSDGIYSSETPAHGLTTYFTEDSVTFSKGDFYNVEMKLSSLGRGSDTPNVLNTQEIKLNDNKIELLRGNVTEWYVNSHFGVEQGFTIDEKPLGNGDLKLSLNLDTSQGLNAVNGEQNTIIFNNTNGTEILRYGKLYVYDSTGAELASAMNLTNGAIEITVDDKNAQYPIVIDPLTFVQRILASDGNSNDDYGYDVDIHGDYAIVGAPTKGEGYAYIYKRDGGGTWVEQTVDNGNPPIGASTDTSIRGEDYGVCTNNCAAFFGWSVDIDGTSGIAVIGAPFDDLGSGNEHGSAWIFERNGGDVWEFVQEIRAQTIGSSDHFGYAVGVSGTTIIVGSPDGDDGFGDNEGEAFVFNRTGAGANPWTLTQRINPDGGQGPDNGANFGTCVSISGTTAVIGAPDEDLGSFSGHGAAWIYTFPWTGNGQRITSNPIRAGASFGTSCNINVDKIIVGAPDEDRGSGSQHGAAYIYENGGSWPTTQTARIVASGSNSGNSGDNFGTDVSISGDKALVGSPDDDNGSGSSHGSAYLYEKSGTWPSTETQKMTAIDASDLGSGDDFGRGVGIDGMRAISGAPFNNIGLQSDQGAAYIYESEMMMADCGDGNVDTGEDCDLGDGVNGTAGSCCSASCTFESAATQCRASAGVCDVAETCTGSSDTCPADGFAASGECRASAGVCDVAESCNGSGPDCPADGYAVAGECRAAAGVCDVAEFCDGSGPDCPVNGFQAGGECRASAGVCDVAEVCSGSGPDCPADAFAPGSQECRASAGVCDIAETCTGSSAACPTDAKQNTSYECRASVDVCDLAEFCDGSTNDCPANALEPSGTVCRASAGSCDIAEECTGDASACPADAFEPDTTECRASAGVCDVAESCTGTGAVCPADGFEPDTTSCRAAVNSCDIEEFCSGSGVECPEDSMMDEGSTCTADNGGPDGQCLRDPLVCVNQGLITIIKEADTPDEDDGQDFEFSCTDSSNAACADMGDENGMFYLDDPVIDDLDLVTDTETSDPMFIGEYTIEEMVPTGWQLDMIECVDDEDGETIADADAKNVLINLDPDEEVMCTFYNSDIPVGITGFNNSNKMQAIKNRDNRIRITGITPEGRVWIFWGFRKGTDFVNGGNCAGTEINIRNMTRLADVRANLNGIVNKVIFIPSTAQNKAYMVPLDLENCMAGKRKQITLLND